MGINVGAPTRAVMLEDHWSFVCTCKRCLDPTELGTYASALRCLACGPGSEALILPMVNKLDGAKATKWCCNTCEMELSREQVEAIVETGLRIIKYVNVSFLFTIETDSKMIALAPHPTKIDLNKEWLPKQKAIQNFKIDAQGFRRTRNENPPMREIGVTS